MRNFLLAFLVITALATPVYPADFSQYSIEYDATKSIVKIKFDINVQNTTGLDVSVFTKPTDLQVQTSVPSRFSLNEGDAWNVAIDFLEPTSGNISVIISFKASLAEKLRDRNLFTFVFQSPGGIDNFKLSLILPQGSSVYTINERPVISPDAEITTNGQNIILVWRDSLNLGNERVFLASYTDAKSNSLVLPLAGLIAIGIILIGLYFFTHSKSRKIIYKSLSEDEQSVYEIVKKENGITQDKVRNLSEFSKSKLSKVVRNLEHKGVIRKVPYKKTNKLEIKI